MKRIAAIMMCTGLVFFASCGGSSGGSSGGTGAQEAEDAFDDFGLTLDQCIQTLFGAQTVGDEASVEKQVAGTCNCPGGGTMTGTVSADQQTATLTVSQCKSAAGYTYNGTLTTTDGGNTINGNMDEFGFCSSASATSLQVQNTCGGTISANCPGGSVTCTVVDPATGTDGCDLNC